MGDEEKRLFRDALFVGVSAAAVWMLDEAGHGRLADLALDVEKRFADDATLILEHCSQNR